MSATRAWRYGNCFNCMSQRSYAPHGEPASYGVEQVFVSTEVAFEAHLPSDAFAPLLAALPVERRPAMKAFVEGVFKASCSLLPLSM